jgi:hypothetical protein
MAGGKIAPGEVRNPAGGGKAGRKQPSQLLKDMRAVYADRPPEGGWSKAQAMLAKMFEDDPKGFMSQLSGLEKSHGGGRHGAGPAEPSGQVREGGAPGEDAGTARSVKVLEDWLKNWRASPEAKA